MSVLRSLLVVSVVTTSLVSLVLSRPATAQSGNATSRVGYWYPEGSGLSVGTGFGTYDPDTEEHSGGLSVSGPTALDPNATAITAYKFGGSPGGQFDGPSFAYLKNETGATVYTNTPHLYVYAFGGVDRLAATAASYTIIGNALAIGEAANPGGQSSTDYLDDDYFNPAASEPNNILIIASGTTRRWTGEVDGGL